MRLNVQTDYALRQLMYLAVNKQRLCTIQEISGHYGISKNHMMKVAYLTGRAGFVETIRGRAGGMTLKLPASEIAVGDVVRKMEPDFAVAECFQRGGNNKCLITPACRLKGALKAAVNAFVTVLDDYTVADLVEDNTDLTRLLFQKVA